MPAGATHLPAKAPLRGLEETHMKLITPKIRTQLRAGHFPAGQLFDLSCCLGSGPSLTA
jgi:hypothetical protein